MAKRRHYTLEFKRQLVGEAFRPGVSVAGVAMAHKINANLLRNRRSQLLLMDGGQVEESPPRCYRSL
jgi:transposase-like protein